MSTSTAPPEEDRFWSNARALSQKLVEEISSLQSGGYCKNVPSHLLAIITPVISAYNRTNLIRGFIRNGSPYWEEIRNKNLVFFGENADAIFAAKLPIQNVYIFRELFSEKDAHGAPLIKAETIDYIWNNFQAMVKISIKYVHRERQPTIYQDEAGNNKIRYANPDFFPELNVAELAKIWNITLSP